MATFVSTIRFSEKGLEHIQNTCDRAEEFKSKAAAMGVEVKEILWTLGDFDGIVLFDAPDDETATALILQLGSRGNIRTNTARAFGVGQMKQLLGKLSG